MSTTDRKYAIEGKRDSEAERIDHMVRHMDANHAYRAARDAAGGDGDGALLESFRARFRWYRAAWRDLPRQAVEQKLTGDAFRAAGNPPLCVDLESAAVCDLACPFCYRQFVATPDKVMRLDVGKRIIDQAAELGVPSMKFNWRGEPLLNPKLPELIAHAKDRGILETIINTNATELDEKTAHRLIDAGLDLMIYSFDGGTKESYERMRPGRFKENSFDAVYANIRRFAAVRAERGGVFPRTKIQMILTEETHKEQDAFVGLFSDCVDDVSVKQYTERGAGIAEFDPASKDRLAAALAERGLPDDTACLRDGAGNLFVATGRLPCEQPYQRLLVTYDGRVGMCCYDWGARHPVGYVADDSFADPDKEFRAIVEKSEDGAKGFQDMPGVAMPEHFNTPRAQVETLGDIWTGAEIDAVRRAHAEDKADTVAVCKACPFKETYRWEQVS